jgi:hypothetical protein
MSVILLHASVSALHAAPAAVLKIVVGEGEGAVNIIQQKRMSPVALSSVIALAFLHQAPASAAEGPGGLRVESDPAGATVYVDGHPAGQTPVTVATLAPGVHRVRLIRAGYLENSRLVTIRAGARGMVRTQLTAAAPPLKIVVVEGEGAVNIIQQKTAVSPVIEVRDRNDQPVSGALVRFAIQKGRASFNGARTLTATTNALGRATATGLTPIGNGPLQIGASAAFQGQTAAISIAQTNVVTAAQASTAAGGGSGTAGGGGGLSHLAIAGIAGGAGAGAAAALIASKESSGSSSSGITRRTFAGPFSGQNIVTATTTFAAGSNTCVSTQAITGTLTLQIEQRADGTVTGSGSTTGTRVETAVTQSPSCNSSGLSVTFNYNGPITGSDANITWAVQTFAPNRGPGTVDSTHTLRFTGSLSNGVITGTLNFTEAYSGTNTSGSTTTGSGSTSFTLTLR